VIAVLDYGMGNIGSMLNMMKRIGRSASIVSNAVELKSADKIILPGVGSFDAAMKKINSVSGLRQVLEAKVLQQRVPLLGVCLGMQLLTRGSEEGRIPGLGWIPADTVRLPSLPGLKVPHMGWNIAMPVNKSTIARDIQDDARFYFVHSYCVHVDDTKHAIMRTHYGCVFDSAIGYENIYGVQFHPEKSHRFGMEILRNFASIE
jgi:glutamine amidotransferase